MPVQNKNHIQEKKLNFSIGSKYTALSFCILNLMYDVMFIYKEILSLRNIKT